MTPAVNRNIFLSVMVAPADGLSARDLQLAGTHAVRAACDAVQLIAPSAGTSAVRNSSGLTRHLRDLNTLTQHAFITVDRYEDVGAISVGQPAKWGFMAF